MTPRAIDQEEYVNREGKSAFYAPTTSTVSKIHSKLDIANKSVRVFLFTISNNSLYQMYFA